MKKISFQLFFSIAIVELLLILSLRLIEIGASFFWLPMLLDALLISITAIITVSLLLKKSSFSIHQKGQGAWKQIQIGVIVFFFEILIIQFFEYQLWALKEWEIIVLDSLSIALLSSLGIYFIVLKPVEHGHQRSDVTKARFDASFITIFFAYLSVITILMMFLVLSYQQQFNELKKDLVEQEVNSQQLLKTAFTQQLSELINDVLIIGQQVGVVEYLSDLTPQRKQDLIKDFQTHAVYKSEYDQLRLLNNSGQELIRIDQGEDGLPVVVDHSLLQDKSVRYYFKESASMLAQQVYLSRIDLNKEYGEIELPYKPVLRVASAVLSENVKKGIVILNFKAQILLDTLAHLSIKDKINRQFLDQYGYWLFGGGDNKQWGFMFADEQQTTLKNEKPMLWDKLQQKEKGVFDSGQRQVVFQSVGVEDVVNLSGFQYIIQKPHWYLVSFIPNSLITGQLDKTRLQMIFVYLVISLLLGLGAYLLFLAMRQKEMAESKVLQMLYSDTLTGLRNRKYFQWKLLREIADAKENQSTLAIFYIDLNKFKSINDDLGHEAGDMVLQKVAGIVLHCLRDNDTVARIAGDEFAAIIPDVVKDQDLSEISQRIFSLTTEGMDIGGMNLNLEINIGIATMNNYDEPVRSFIARADQAMYESKASDSENYIFADKYRTIKL